MPWRLSKKKDMSIDRIARDRNARERQSRIYHSIAGGTSMSDAAKRIIEKVNEKLNANPGIAEKVNTMYQFVINGEGGGNWWLDLTKTPPEIGEGVNGDAACTITMDAVDFVAMVKKDASPVKLFMSGKLKIGGDITAAMKLQNII